MTTVVCWNICKRSAPWNELLAMDADVALLQEAGKVPPDLPSSIDTGSITTTGDRWNDLVDFKSWPLVVKLSDRVKVEWFKRVLPLYRSTGPDEMVVSDVGTIAAARVIPREQEPFIVVSMYSRWLRPHSSTSTKWVAGYSDASTHRIISDLSAFIGDLDSSTHRILAAGDLNTVLGSTDTKLVLPDRDRMVFERMDALGLEFMGPQHPDGRQTIPTPSGLPENTRNVPTFYAPKAKTPENAVHQLDYVFASRGFHSSLRVRALNDPDEWGSSDHCRILIEVS
ncbi:MAG: hypothetical protein OXH02_07155 [Gemmatimonadetes bacterium]|nr:hypothetical protein [Gemmatimonadota bacterium]